MGVLYTSELVLGMRATQAQHFYNKGQLWYKSGRLMLALKTPSRPVVSANSFSLRLRQALQTGY